jgi:hypothetical protein
MLSLEEKNRESIKERLESLPNIDLGRLHLYLTNFIVNMQTGRIHMVERDSIRIREILGFNVDSVLEADRIRNLAHKILIERARNNNEKVKLNFEGKFAIPDIEAFILANIDKFPDGTEITITPKEISVYWEGEDRTLYDEPVQEYFFNITYVSWDKGSFVELRAEIADRFSDMDMYFADAEPIEKDEAIKLIKQYAPHLMEIIEGHEDEIEFYTTRNEAYLFTDPSAQLPDGRIIFGLFLDDSYEYVSAHFFRNGGDVRSGVIEEHNRKLGGEYFKLDRIYHVFPAELDAGAPGDSVVHASLSEVIDIKTPNDERKVTELSAKIIKLLFLH